MDVTVATKTVQRISLGLYLAVLLILGALVVLGEKRTPGAAVMSIACPHCFHRIGPWDQIASRQPNEVTCSNCDTRIQERVKYWSLLLVTASVSFVFFALSVVVPCMARQWRQALISFALFIPFYAILELGTCFLVFNYAQLVTRG